MVTCSGKTSYLLKVFALLINYWFYRFPKGTARRFFSGIREQLEEYNTMELETKKSKNNLQYE